MGMSRQGLGLLIPRHQHSSATVLTNSAIWFLQRLPAERSLGESRSISFKVQRSVVQIPSLAILFPVIA